MTPLWAVYSSASSFSVLSGRSRMSALNSSSFSAGMLRGIPPPCGNGSTPPVFRNRLSTRLTVARPTEKCSATSSYVFFPSFHRATMRSRRSVEMGLLIPGMEHNFQICSSAPRCEAELLGW